MTDPAALRAALGDPAGVPADRLDGYWAAIAAGADAAPPPPAGAADLSRRILGPSVRDAARQQTGRAA
jgi:hypothetical protein